ncbi:uncharacterized protein LOC132696606 [Cylas formicarius]|uniref:uncharacterized protein LOC132696606 n=1 Tax=Cylas formicarius TaxID=197179 RepID=UPI002958C300|nr:uncharacterized protein LOC132696606 [Cylas formicarius]
MEMFTLPNFCRVCLKYDKNLIDLAHIENEPSETLMSKLQLCVSEVEWTTFKPLLCHPCIKRLNIAYSFKKQCVQSAGVLKNYVELVKESQKKNESQQNVTPKTESGMPPGGAYMLLPNQKYVKILVGSQNQGTTGNTFQNVFLNLIPTATLNAVPASSESAQTNKDTNQNVFLNLNNTFQKFIPLAPIDTSIKVEPPPLKKCETTKPTNVNVNQLLTDSKAEEMSVEIDPTSLLQLEHDDGSNEESAINDWDEVITHSKIDPKETKVNGDVTLNGKDSMYGNYVPILPKQEDFFSGQHFLSGSFEPRDIVCESCQRTFPSLRLLKQHFKHFHLGKLPFKCEYCYTEHLTRSDYESCVKSHKLESDSSTNTSLTLKDFATASPQALDALSLSDFTTQQNLIPNENGHYVCDICNHVFKNSAGVLRHKVRKHNHREARKKYFIKGMKNAKCDICQREFSTQSYMQLHRKLHMRDDKGYKYKVLGRSKYDLSNEDKDKEDKADKPSDDKESHEGTQEDEEHSDSNGEHERKKRKISIESQDDSGDEKDKGETADNDKKDEVEDEEDSESEDEDHDTDEQVSEEN